MLNDRQTGADKPRNAGERVEPFLDYQESLACIHCGLCLSSCPTYLETGNENDSPRGRIYLMRALQDGRLALGATAVRHLDLCLGCRACESACPSGVQYGNLIEHTRAHIQQRFPRSIWQNVLRRVLVAGVFPFPWRLRLALLPARLLRWTGAERLLPKWAREAVSLVPTDTNALTLPEISPGLHVPPRGRVGFVSGCVMSAMFGRTNQASVRLLNRAGYEVITPRTQVCCGALYAHGGELERARACARRNIQAFEPLALQAIITNAAGCGSTLKAYGQLLAGDPVWSARAKDFSNKVRDLTQWLSMAGQSCGSAAAPGDASRQVVTCHDACHLAHAQGITQEPRDLVKTVAGHDFIELAEADVCCGSAGSYNLTEPAMAERLQRRKIEHILESGARIVVTTNPGCILQIRAGLRKAGATHVAVVHIADFLANSGGAE